MSSPVKPEFGPTLPELAGPRWRAAPRRARVAIPAAAVVLLASLLIARSQSGERREVAVVTGPVAHNLLYQPDRLRRVAPEGEEALRLETPPGAADPAEVTVSPVTLPPYAGEDPYYVLPTLATRLIEEMRRREPGFILRSEGKARVNSQPGYQIQYQLSRGGRTWYGRRALLFPDPREEPGARAGADVDVRAARSDVVPNVDEVGSNGPTKLPYRSFRLGTERP